MSAAPTRATESLPRDWVARRVDRRGGLEPVEGSRHSTRTSDPVPLVASSSLVGVGEDGVDHVVDELVGLLP